MKASQIVKAGFAFFLLLAFAPWLLQMLGNQMSPRPSALEEPEPRLTNAVAPVQTLSINGSVTAMALSRDRQLLLVAEERNPPLQLHRPRSLPPKPKPQSIRTFRVWHLPTGKTRYTLPLKEPVTALSLSADGQSFVMASRNFQNDDLHHGSLVVREVASGKLRQTLASKDSGQYAEFSPRGAVLASDHRDGVRLWQFPEGKVLRTIKSDRILFGLAFSPDGKWLAIGDSHVEEKTLVRLWDWRKGTSAATFQTGTSLDARSLTFSPNGRWLAVGSQVAEQNRTGGKVQVWDVQTRQLRQTFLQANIVNSVAISPNGQWLASGQEEINPGSGALLSLWNLQTGQHLRRLSGPVRAVDRLAFSADGQLLVSSSNGAIHIWQMNQLIRP